MVLPIYAGLERLPNSLLEAAGDLGAKSGRTFFSVVVPLLKPAIIAGSIFTFSLSLGDYITCRHRRRHDADDRQRRLRNFGANNLPFAAALATIPVVMMVIYLLAVRRTGALDNL